MKTKELKSKLTRLLSLQSIISLLVTLLVPLMVPAAHAGTLSSTSLLSSRMIAATSSLSVDQVLTFTPATTVGAGYKIVINYTNLTGASTPAVLASGVTLNNSRCNGATLIPGSPSETTASGIATISSATGTMNSGSTYCVTMVGLMTTTPTAGNYTVAIATQTSGAVGVDNTTVGVDYISSDIVSVTASVPPSFTLALPASIAMGTITPGTRVASSAASASVTTNAAKGYAIYAADANAGLNSPTASHTIASVATGALRTVTTTTENFALGVNTTTGSAGTGTPTANANYSDSAPATNFQGGGVTTIATGYNAIASSNGSGQADQINLYGIASATVTTPAAPDYGDNLYIVGAGSF